MPRSVSPIPSVVVRCATLLLMLRCNVTRLKHQITRRSWGLCIVLHAHLLFAGGYAATWIRSMQWACPAAPSWMYLALGLKGELHLVRDECERKSVLLYEQPEHRYRHSASEIPFSLATCLYPSRDAYYLFAAVGGDSRGSTSSVNAK